MWGQKFSGHYALFLMGFPYKMSNIQSRESCKTTTCQYPGFAQLILQFGYFKNISEQLSMGHVASTWTLAPPGQVGTNASSQCAHEMARNQWRFSTLYLENEVESERVNNVMKLRKYHWCKLIPCKQVSEFQCCQDDAFSIYQIGFQSSRNVLCFANIYENNCLQKKN